MRKGFLLSLALGLSALSAVGCGSSGGGSSTVVPPPIVLANHLYVSDGNSPGAIYIYALPLAPGAMPSGEIAGLANPFDMKFDPSGRLFVGSANASGKVSVFAAPVTSASTPSFSLTTGHSASQYLALDGSNDLFVASTNVLCCVDVFNAPVVAGSAVGFTMTGNGQLGSLGNPSGLSFDSSGKLYTADENSIQMYTPPFSAASKSTAAVQTVTDGNDGVAVGPTNQLYVENATSVGTIDVFTTPLTSASVRSFSLTVSPGFALVDIAVDTTGNLYVTGLTAGAGKVYYIPAPITSASVPTISFTPPTGGAGIAFGP